MKGLVFLMMIFSLFTMNKIMASEPQGVVFAPDREMIEEMAQGENDMDPDSLGRAIASEEVSAPAPDLNQTEPVVNAVNATEDTAPAPEDTSF